MATNSFYRNTPPHRSLRAVEPILTLRSRAEGTTPPPIASRPTPIDTTDDDALIAILDAPLVNGETAHAGFARKEQELGTAFASLDVAQSRALHARLSNAKPDDELAQKFARLTIERRVRLLVFLADARRREAMRGPSPLVLRSSLR